MPVLSISGNGHCIPIKLIPENAEGKVDNSSKAYSIGSH